MKGKRDALPSLFALVLAASCAVPGPRIAPLLQGSAAVPAVELAAVPFFGQVEYHCGPASLAAVLVHAGIDTSPEELAGEVFIPGRKGSVQIEMNAAVRRRGLIPSPLRPEMKALIAELAAGRPVLVLQDLGVPWLHRWHYAVVVGFRADHDSVLLRSGATRRKEMRAPLFARTWEASGNWGFAVLRPGDLPAGADREGYLLQVAALEEGGRAREAEAGYDAALAVWPGDESALLGRGNAIFRQGETERAITAFRALLDLHPESAAGRNNLAHLHMESGRLDEAERQIRLALEVARSRGDDLSTLLETEQEIRRRSPPAGPAPRP